MNKVILIGRLTKEVQLRKTPKGDSVANFTLAVSRVMGDEADFINCVAWNKTADFMQEWVEKGKRVCVVGRMQSRPYEKDGKTITLWDVVVESVEPIDWKEKQKAQGVEKKSVLERYVNNDWDDDDDENDKDKIKISSDDLPF